jgi:hypothetical protein
MRLEVEIGSVWPVLRVEIGDQCENEKDEGSGIRTNTAPLGEGNQSANYNPGRGESSKFLGRRGTMNFQNSAD